MPENVHKAAKYVDADKYDISMRSVERNDSNKDSWYDVRKEGTYDLTTKDIKLVQPGDIVMMDHQNGGIVDDHIAIVQKVYPDGSFDTIDGNSMHSAVWVNHHNDTTGATFIQLAPRIPGKTI